MIRKTAKKPMLTLPAGLMFSSGSLGYSAVQQACCSLIIFFGMMAHNMPPLMMGLAAALGLAWDAVIDPIVGYISDRTKSVYFGRRYGYIVAAVFGLALVNVFLWSVPHGFPTVLKFIWFVVFLILFNTLQSLLQTPYHALGLELCGDAQEKIALNSYKNKAWLIGLCVPVAAMGTVLKNSDIIEQYMNIAYIVSTVLLISGMLTVFGTYRHLPRLRAKAEASSAHEKLSVKQIILSFFDIFRSWNFRAIIIGYAVSLMSLALVSSLGIYFFRFVFLMNFWEIAVLLGVLNACAVLTQNLWNKLADKRGKKPVLLAAIIVALSGVLVTMLFFILIKYAGINLGNPLIILCIGMILSGAGFGAMLSLPASIFNDQIAILSKNDEKLKTGTYNAHITFAYKISQAVTLAFVGMGLQIAKVKPVLEQTAAAQHAIAWILLGGMLLSLGAGLFIYAKYAVKPEEITAEDA